MTMPISLQAGQSLASHRLLRAIGQGASGTVFLAEHETSGAVVAMKVVVLPPGAGGTGTGTGTGAGTGTGGHDAAGQQFLQAAQAAMRLRHPGIVEVFAAGLQGRLAWLTMEPVPGSDLVRYTQAPRLLPEAVVLRIAARLAQALAHAHRQGVVHRDLKPANVRVNWADDAVKLLDLGLARSNSGVETQTGALLGTPLYMAPEQLAGALPSPASDFYALGVLMFELLSGRLPHEPTTSMGDLLRRIAQEPAPDLLALRPALPATLGSWVARLLAKAPAARPTDGQALAAALQILGASLPGGGAKSR
ncbi:MAG: serine/threonine protein kinase [Rubrivivax sp.]|nr:serine/threonine protein kinase [Rubrivivax sp.]